METVDSRTKRSLNNIAFSLIAYFIQIVLGFIVRRYFIYYIGAGYLGLTALFSNVLSILSLAELGFGTAIVFSMYKPMAEGDEEKVRQLLSIYKKFYFIVSCIILVIGLALTPFIQFLIKDAPGITVNLHVVFLILLINTVISYFFAHRRALLYTSQRNDIESKINIISNIFLTLLQLLVLFTIKNYYIYITLGIFTTVFNNFLVWLITQRRYSRFLKKPSNILDALSKTNLKKNVQAMIYHQVGSVIVFSTSSILIARLLTNGLEVLGRYSNYLLITTYVGTILGLLLNSIKDSIGNSVALQSMEENYKLYKNLNFIFFWIVGFCSICLFVLIEPFISIVLTKSLDNNLLLGKNITLLICISFFLTQSRRLTGIFTQVNGLFRPWKLKSIFEAIINLIVSVLLGLWIGLAGILIGVVVSTVVLPLWVEPHVLNKYYFKRSTVKYLNKYLIYAGSTVIAGFITWLTCSFIPNGSLLLLLAKFAVCAVLPNIVLLSCLFWMPEFKEVIRWGKTINKNRKGV